MQLTNNHLLQSQDMVGRTTMLGNNSLLQHLGRVLTQLGAQSSTSCCCWTWQVDRDGTLSFPLVPLPCPARCLPVLPSVWKSHTCSCSHPARCCLQMQLLRKVHEGLEQENTLRRSMLVKRAKLTLDSLLTSPRLVDQGTQVRLCLILQQAPNVHAGD